MLGCFGGWKQKLPCLLLQQGELLTAAEGQKGELLFVVSGDCGEETPVQLPETMRGNDQMFTSSQIENRGLAENTVKFKNSLKPLGTETESPCMEDADHGETLFWLPPHRSVYS